MVLAAKQAKAEAGVPPRAAPVEHKTAAKRKKPKARTAPKARTSAAPRAKRARAGQAEEAAIMEHPLYVSLLRTANDNARVAGTDFNMFAKHGNAVSAPVTPLEQQHLAGTLTTDKPALDSFIIDWTRLMEAYQTEMTAALGSASDFVSTYATAQPESHAACLAAIREQPRSTLGDNSEVVDVARHLRSVTNIDAKQLGLVVEKAAEPPVAAVAEAAAVVPGAVVVPVVAEPPAPPPVEAGAGAGVEYEVLNRVRDLKSLNAKPLSDVAVNFLKEVDRTKKQVAKARPRRLGPAQLFKLKMWMADHFDHPYPSDKEKAVLAEELGVTSTQVATWFQNARRRLWAPIKNGSVAASGATPHELLFGKELFGPSHLRSPLLQSSVHSFRKLGQQAAAAPEPPLDPTAAGGAVQVSIGRKPTGV